jgi:hypothetical protein
MRLQHRCAGSMDVTGSDARTFEFCQSRVGPAVCGYRSGEGRPCELFRHRGC